MALKQFGGDQYVLQFRSFCHHLRLWAPRYRHRHHRSRFWLLEGAQIDYPTCPGDGHKWSTAEFKEWRASRDPCFIVDLSVLDPFDPCLPTDILRDYALKFEVRVESTLKDLKECLIEAIKDRDC